MNQDVEMFQVEAKVQAEERESGSFQILCDINTDGVSDLTSLGDPEQLCSLSLSVDENFQRVFFSASVGFLSGEDDDSGGTDWGANVWMELEGQELVPRDEINLVFGQRIPSTITAAVDLPAGDYNVALKVSAEVIDTLVSTGPASMQAILGQQVDGQNCWVGGGGDG